jgi:hypothetical protein
MDNGAEIEAVAGSSPSFAAWEQNEPYTIALLIKGRSGGTGTKHLYRSGSSSTGDHILFLTSGTTPNLRHQASGGGTVSITSSVAILNDTTWSTLVGTWRPGRLELYVDGWSRASSTAAATSTSALFGIYRWGWSFSTSQDFNGDIALIACFASWTPAMVRRWHADPFGFLRPWNEVPALMGSAPPATPPSSGTGVITFLMGQQQTRFRPLTNHRTTFMSVERWLARLNERMVGEHRRMMIEVRGLSRTPAVCPLTSRDTRDG